jgi:hypothetical protein
VKQRALLLRQLFALAVLAALAGRPSEARAQIFMEEVPQFRLAGSALVTYTGTWRNADDRLVATHQLSEGVSLSLSGWLYESRFVKFRTYVLVLRLDDMGAYRRAGYSIGYGGSLALLSRSILPVTLSYEHGLAVTGSTLQAAGVTSTTALLGVAQLVSPVLPRVDVRAQRVVAEDVSGSSTTTDTATAQVYGTSSLHRYSVVGSWQGEQSPGQPRTTATLASIRDDATLSQDTRAIFAGTLTRTTGLGGGSGDDVFTSYAASGALLTRLSPRTLVRGQYGFTTDTASDREQTSNQAVVGGTIDLRPVPLMLGEGLSASGTRYVAPGLDRTVDAVSASQGLATHGSWGPARGTASASGQLGYASVSDGASGPVYGYSLNGGLDWAVPRAPVHATAFYAEREDRSSAGTSARSYGTLATSNVGRWYPLFLMPTLSYTHVEQRSFFPAAPDGGLGAPMMFTASDTWTAALTGTSPLYGTLMTFAAGYVDSSSPPSPIHTRQVYGRAGDAFRLGPGTFGNVAVEASHAIGQGANASALASVVWSFRESTLSATYGYALSLPQGSSVHTAALLFTRSFGASFLPESR